MTGDRVTDRKSCMTSACSPASPRAGCAAGRVLLAGVLALSGCYRFTPTTVSELQPGQSVRLDLSAVAVDRVRRGPAEEARALTGFQVSGKVARLGGDSLVLAVENSVLDANARAMTVTRDLSLLRSDVQGAMLRRLDRKRSTWAGVALGTAIVASATWAIKRGGRSSGIIPGSGSPPEIRIPVSLGWLIH